MIEVLLVDDESYVTESLAATIPWQELGVSQVYQADSAADALELLERQPIDIVVTDIQMPEMGGLTLIEKAQAEWPHLRFMLLTGYSEFEYAKKAIQLQVSDYILKPVDDGQFIASLTSMIVTLQQEWEQNEQYAQLIYERRSDLAVLRRNFMHELLLGKQKSHAKIEEQLVKYEIPLRIGQPAVMLLVQLGTYFHRMDERSISLLEYAVGNIAEEVLSRHFAVWHGQSPHNGLTMIAMLKHTPVRTELSILESHPRRLKHSDAIAKMEELLPLFRQHVNEYLKGDISVIVTNEFVFPESIDGVYRTGLRYLLSLDDREDRREFFLQDEPPAEASVKLVEPLYRPPTLLHLIEAQQWDAVRDKLAELFDNGAAMTYSRENVYELYLMITYAFMYASHKHGKTLAQVGCDLLFDQAPTQSLDRLRMWTNDTLQQLQQALSVEEHHTKRHIINQVKQIVTDELGEEISVKTIADRVYLHPVYLSKVFKAETGESLGDYIIRMRMERALYLLKHTNRRIYEITAELGYQNPQYFSKIFKKVYGKSPQEFREG